MILLLGLHVLASRSLRSANAVVAPAVPGSPVSCKPESSVFKVREPSDTAMRYDITIARSFVLARSLATPRTLLTDSEQWLEPEVNVAIAKDKKDFRHKDIHRERQTKTGDMT